MTAQGSYIFGSSADFNEVTFETITKLANDYL